MKEHTVKHCPKCGQPLEIKQNRKEFGKEFLGCSAWQPRNMGCNYTNAIYDARLTRWHQVETKTQAEKGNTRIECLWLNEACTALLDKRPTHEQEAMQI